MASRNKGRSLKGTSSYKLKCGCIVKYWPVGGMERMLPCTFHGPLESSLHNAEWASRTTQQKLVRLIPAIIYFVMPASMLPALIIGYLTNTLVAICVGALIGTWLMKKLIKNSDSVNQGAAQFTGLVESWGHSPEEYERVGDGYVRRLVNNIRRGAV